MTVRKDEFARRRRQLMRMMGKGAIAILPAATEKQRNSDVHYHYRPDSDFHYLTGFSEPEAVNEVLADLAQISHVGAIGSESPEVEEEAFVELVEFLRAAVQLSYEELGAARASLPAPQSGH
jgi:Xaa-Pro aminopeptidase